MSLVRFLILMGIKNFSSVFYRTHLRTINISPEDNWDSIKAVLVLNHTSLWEFLYSAFIPSRFFKRFSEHGMFPIADKTANRPFVGRAFKLFAPKVISLTRKRDNTWSFFLGEHDDQSVVIFFPEGRMKRPNGLDRNGNPMTVRGGFFDLISQIGQGDILFAYAGGLHHIQKPGQFIPKVFKDIYMTLEKISIDDFIKPFADLPPAKKRKALTAELERRRDLYAQEFSSKETAKTY